MKTIIENNNNQLNIEKLFGRICGSVTSKEALSDVTPISWPKEILNGEEKIILTMGAKK